MEEMHLFPFCNSRDLEKGGKKSLPDPAAH